MRVARIDHDLDALSNTRAGAWIEPGNERLAAFFQVQQLFVAHLLHHVDVGFNGGGGNVRRLEVRVVDIFGPDAQDDSLADIRLVGFGAGSVQRYAEVGRFYREFAVDFGQF